MRRGRLISLEGIDGAGTSTQASRMVEAMQRQEYPCHVTREPSDGPVGTLIRQFLSHRLVVPGPSGPRPPRMETMALLFAADRVDHDECEILPNLKDGVTVICDRYLHSSIAYQTLTAPDSEEAALQWVTQINSRSRIPDLVLVLDVPPAEASRRRRIRGGPEQMYEQDALQKRLAAFYADLPRRFPDQNIKVIDGTRSRDEVHADCWSSTLQVLEEERA